MTSLSMRCKSVVLAATMIVSSTSFGSSPLVVEVSANELAKLSLFSSTNSKIVASVVLFTALATWIRLNSKGSKWDYTTENARADFDAFLSSYNIFDAESRATLLRLYDKWIVGRQLSIIDINYKTEDESGMVTTRKEKAVKTKPFGVMGLFDAYVLYQLKKINEHTKEMQGLLLVALLLQITGK